MPHVPKSSLKNQEIIIGKNLLGFKGDIGYFSADSIMAVDGCSQSDNETFAVKI